MNGAFETIVDNLFDLQEFTLLLFRFFVNILFAYIIIDRIYFRINKQREYLFTFFIFNILIFFVSSLLSTVKMKTGFAFGLFAIFSILRYRTEQINIKEMTFLFISIIIAVLNSLVTEQVPLVNILFGNVIITGAAFYLEKIWLKSFNRSMLITYENIELIHRDKTEQMRDDLQNRTGLIVHHFDVITINYLRDTAEIMVYYE